MTDLRGVAMNALIEFVRARLDDEEQCAIAAGHGYGHLPLNAELNAGWTCLDNRENVRLSYDVNFLKRFSPKRIQDEIAVKRKILNLAYSKCGADSAYADGWDDAALWAVKEIACLYSDHRDFDEEWRKRRP
jgi:hypothetical protein